MKANYLVFGDGLLGNACKHILDNVIVLPKSQCDITNREDVRSALAYYSPKIVINAAGIVPRNDTTIENTFKVNSFAPHHIADLCHRKHKYVHLSTDCVFSGARGKYTEKDRPDATDIYGMSKIFGETHSGLIIRTSFVGLPDPKQRGLFAWASQQDEITGYDQVFWNGATTLELVHKIQELAEQDISGIRHVYSYTVSKYELLVLAKEVFGWKAFIHKETDMHTKVHYVNKTLNSVYSTGFIVKPLKRQLEEMAHAISQ